MVIRMRDDRQRTEHGDRSRELPAPTAQPQVHCILCDRHPDFLMIWDPDPETAQLVGAKSIAYPLCQVCQQQAGWIERVEDLLSAQTQAGQVSV